MVSVRRSNVVLNVKESEVQHYLSLGYDVVDERGKVIKEAEPRDFATLLKRYNEDRVKLEALEKELADNKAYTGKLKAEYDKLKAVFDKATSAKKKKVE